MHTEGTEEQNIIKRKWGRKYIYIEITVILVIAIILVLAKYTS